MSPKYELTESPPPEAFQKMWAPLLKFNEAAVGNATARMLAVLLKDSTTDELIGGLWARSLWGSLFIDIMFVPEPLRGTGIGTSLLRNNRSLYAIEEQFLAKCLGGRAEPITVADLKGSSVQVLEGADHIDGLALTIAQAAAATIK
jgi:hypothetical protein